MKKLTVIVPLLLSCIGFAQQAAPAPSAAPADQGMEERMKALEDRIITLEGELRQLKAAAPANAAPAAPAPQAEAAAATAAPVGQPAAADQAQQTAQAQDAGIQLGGAGGSASKALNPDISVIGDFLGSVGKNNIRPVPSLEMHETELGIQAIVDPYARADFFISFGEQGVNLEEGFITFTSLPAGLLARAGKMRAAFGKVNTLHNHVLPWVDRPLVTENLVGGEDGIDDAGFSISRNFQGPRNILLEATGQLFRGDSGDLFKASNRSDVSTVARLRAYKDLSESTNLDLGFSFARGHNDVGSNFLTQLYGADATVRWKPLRRSIYHSFIGRSEFVWSQRQQLPAMQRAFGFYTSGDYQLGRRWFIGGRFDSSDRAQDATMRDRGGSAILTYWPSEFSQIRAQYRHTRYAEGMNANELRMQIQFAIGAHGAHTF